MLRPRKKTTLVEHNIETGGEGIQTKQGERGSKQIVKGEHDLQKKVELGVVKLETTYLLQWAKDVATKTFSLIVVVFSLNRSGKGV